LTPTVLPIKDSDLDDQEQGKEKKKERLTCKKRRKRRGNAKRTIL